MAYGVTRVFPATMASGLTSSSGIDMGERDWTYRYLEVPTMVSGADIYIQGSSDNSTFRRVQAIGPAIVSYSVSIASAITLTSAFDFGDGIINPYLLIPTLNTGTSILIQGSIDNSTFRRIEFPVTSSGSTSVDFSIATFAANTARFVPLPTGFRYLKVELATGVSDVTTTLKIIGTKTMDEFDFVIPSGMTNRIVPIPNAFRYMKVELSSFQTNNATTFNVICSD